MQLRCVDAITPEARLRTSLLRAFLEFGFSCLRQSDFGTNSKPRRAD